MQTALVIILLLAILAGAVFVGHTDGYQLATSHACMGLADDGTRYLLVGCGLMALVFYSSHFDEPPQAAQEKKHRAAKWTKMIPKAQQTALVLAI